ncbi:MAG: imidazole glycerol phosphate synthase subunit HisH, partial [Gammaproteobacteria bacterium]|nr:imidazole glycerol phosphate synthase subunit HisH [Gammaproteobacteria bacterium]
ADKILLPGVGAMRDCMGEMQALDLIETIKESAQNKPFLGICIGMQALLTHSDENNGVACLDIFKGNVVHFSDGLKENNLNLKIPHMGWNTVQQSIEHPMWNAIKQDEFFYFVHSYYALPENSDHIAATSTYGEQFTAAISKDNIFATQFHPEKSADAGLQLYSNFINWNGESDS